MFRLRFSVLVLMLFLALPTSSSLWANGTSPNVLVLPQGPGSIGGLGENVQANLNMGLMSYTIGVVVPEGRNGHSPAISITYSSGGSPGVMGIGWSFNAGGSISRLTVRGLPKYDNTDRFFSGGELVKVPNSPYYRSRIEGGFARFRWIRKDDNDQQGYWVAELPNGSKAYYGASADGKTDTEAQVYGTEGTFQWEMKTAVDRNGNRIEYTYSKDGTQSYLDKISWVFDKSGNALYQAEFVYEARTDFISDGRPGFDLQTKKRVKEIRITSNGQSFRTYKFEYEDATGLSRLTKVLRYGRDGKTLFPVTFVMKYSDATFSAANSKLVQMKTSLGINLKNGDADFVDINGDGLPDVVNTSVSQHQFYINKLSLTQDLKQDTHDFPKSAILVNPKGLASKLSNPSVQLLDYNGDGFTDLVNAATQIKQIYLNKGNGKWEDQSQSVEEFPVKGDDPNLRFFDYNGDKAIDIIRSNGDTTTYWVNDKNGKWVKVDGGKGIGASFDKDLIRLIDINGDNLTDAVWITKTSLRYKKYLGYGKWSDWINVTVPGIENYELSTKAQFADVNGDGMADMVTFLGNKIVYFVNKNGMEFQKGQEIQSFQGQNIPDSTNTIIRITDINGNGSRDIVWLTNTGQITYLELFSKRPNLLTEISNSMGQRINVDYGSSVYYYLRDQSCDPKTDEACEGPWQNKMPMAFTVTTKITTWASQSDKPEAQSTPTTEEKPTVQKIYYHNGYYDGTEKQFRGFRKVESVYVGDSSIATRRDFIEYNVGDTDVYFHGKPLRTVTMDDKDKIYREVKTEWKDCGTPSGADANLNPPVRFICMNARESIIKEGLASDQWKTIRTEYDYDGYGNKTLMKNLGIKDKEGDELVLKSSYITPSNPKAEASIWNLRSLKKLERCIKEAGPCAEINYFYDGEAFQGLPAGELTKGNLSRITIKASLTDNTYVELKRRKYDDYGNVIEEKGPTTQRRTYEWDSTYFRFPVKETIYIGAISLTASTDWDYSLNEVTRSTDINGNVTTYTYDNFGRLLSVFQNGDPQDKPSVQYKYELQPPLSKITVLQRSVQGGEQDRKKVDCYDGLGRKLSQQIWVSGNKYSVVNHHRYNSRGKIDTYWNTYEGDGNCSFVPSQANQAQATTLQFDALGREIKKTFPDQSYSEMVYKPFRVEMFDTEDTRKESPHFNTPRIVILDGLNRTIEDIQTIASGKTLSTKYTYNSVNAKMKHLTASMTFPDGTVKTQEYNLLGHLTKIIDPDRSTVSMKYDDNGNLIERIDGRGRVTVYTYDVQGRILTRQEKDKADTKITYTYDIPSQDFPTATNLKGRLASVSFPSGTMYHSYSVRGDKVLSRHVTMGTTFEVKRTFNNMGETTSETFPDGRKVTYTYDGAGRVSAIPGFVKSITYLPNGAIGSRTSENGVVTNFTFTPRMRIKGIEVKSNPGFKYEMTQDTVGNITSLQETYNGQTLQNTYTYDGLYRLTEASLDSGKEVLKYGLDNNHNLTTKTSSLGKESAVHVGNYTYDAKKIHAATQAGDIKMSYDDGGMMTQCGPYQYTWDYAGRMKSSTINGKTGRYWYDQTYFRMIKEEDGVHAFYPFYNYRIQDGHAKIYVRLVGDVVAEWRGTQGAVAFFDDLAPATGDSTLTPKPDGTINVADAWVYYAGRNKLLTIKVKERNIDLDLTKDMLDVAVDKLLQTSDEKLYIHTDHLGSVRMVTDSTGASVGYKRYYPYGSIQKKEGNLQVLDFQGQERDALTNTTFFGARHLDNKLGKWLSPDPLFEEANGSDDEWNSYAMVSNNPLRFRDRDGMASDDGVLWTSVASGTLGAAAAITVGIMTSHNNRINKSAHGKKTNYTQRAMAFGAFLNAGLGITATALMGAGHENTAKLFGIAMGAIGTIRGMINTFFEMRKYNTIRQFNPTEYSKTRHRIGVTARAVSAVASATQTGLLAFGGDSTGAFIGAMAAAGVGIAASLTASGAIKTNWSIKKPFNVSTSFSRSLGEKKFWRTRGTRARAKSTAPLSAAVAGFSQIFFSPVKAGPDSALPTKPGIWSRIRAKFKKKK
ncbi:MAG: hypothetical protein EP343_18360 [Deltaproteobacteria bacterium]|nr:MAG: hypothetical protein EP343_18360 [Deltaproteobacteria bacterium]